jgi:glycosyltransferase involved in cell wall biosynthesis
MMAQDDSKMVRVMVATPLGAGGRGGIDRLNDLIFDAIDRSDIQVQVERLTTRGKGSLFAAQFIFAWALLRLGFNRLQRKVDVLHIHLSDKGSSYRKTIVGRVAEALGIPYVVHLHGAIFAEFWSGASPLVAGAIDRLFERSEQIVVLGNYWAGVVRDHLPHVSSKVVVIPNATPARRLAAIPAQDGVVRITCLGELGERKGTPQLIEALARVAHIANWSATIAGNGRIEESRLQVRKHGIDGRVTIPGWLEADAVNDLLCRTDVLVLPSFAENLPMAVLEAFAHGIPVISTPAGATAEAVQHGRNGLLVPAGDVFGLAQALERLIEDDDLRDRMGKVAEADHAERYDIGKYVRRLSALWLRAAKRSSVGLHELTSS